jgi:hypothetical protein
MSERDLEVFLIQRRVILLNYLYETTNEEHRAMIPEYLEESLRRIRKFLQLQLRVGDTGIEPVTDTVRKILDTGFVYFPAKDR